jgi:hypothetical protein
MNVTSRQATIYKFTFSQTELQSAGGLESEQLDYMERQARIYLQREGVQNIGGDMSWWFSYDERPSELTLSI